MTTDIKQRISNFWSLAAIPIVLILIVPPRLLEGPGIGLDLSWRQAFVYFLSHVKNFRFGTDLVFTYGPLGFFITRHADSMKMVSALVLFDVYMIVNLLFIVSRFYPLKNYWHFILLIVTLNFFSRVGNNITWPSESSYLLLFLFCSFQFLKTRNPLFLINAVAFSAVCVFIKLNFALIQGMMLVGVLLYSLWTGRLSLLKIASLFLLFAVIVFSLGFIFNVDIYRYIRNSYEVMAGYNDGMVITIAWGAKRLQIAILVVISTGIIFLIALVRDRRNFDSLLRIAYVGGSIFLIFKYAFLRADVSHWPVFYRNVLPVLSLLVLFEEGFLLKVGQYLWLHVFVFVFFFLSDPFMGKEEVKNILPIQYASDLAHPSAKFDYPAKLKSKHALPSRLKEEIGTASVDIMPWELSYLLINHLNYQPRPTLQTFCAYNYFSDTINSIHFNSAKAPTYVLYSCISIDGRYPFGDESMTKRTLLANYTLQDSFKIHSLANYYDPTDGYLLLKKNPTPKHWISKSSKKFTLQFNQKYYPDTSGLQFLYSDIQTSLYGKIKTTLFQPDLVQMAVCYENDHVDTFLAIIPIMKTGILINKKVVNPADAYTYFSTCGEGNMRVKWFCFFADNSKSFNPQIKSSVREMLIER